MFQRSARRRSIYARFASPWDIRIVPDAELFPPGKLSRTISLNSHYFVIFRNPRDSLGISTLAKQMFPGHTDYLMQSFCDATSRPYGYLVIDCHQLTPENVRLRTNILPGETDCIRETDLNLPRRRDRSLSRCRSA